MHSLAKRNDVFIILTSVLSVVVTYIAIIVTLWILNIDFYKVDVRLKIIYWTLPTSLVYLCVHLVFIRSFKQRNLPYLSMPLHIINYTNMGILGFLLTGSFELEYLIVLGMLYGVYVMYKEIFNELKKD